MRWGEHFEQASPPQDGGTSFADAWNEALRVQAEAEEREREREKRAAADVEEMVYDPRPAPANEQMYAGTGIGALYGMPRSEWALPLLGEWHVRGVSK